MFAPLQLLLHFRSALDPANMGNILSFLFPDDKPAIKTEPKGKVSLIFTQLSSKLSFWINEKCQTIIKC